MRPVILSYTCALGNFSGYRGTSQLRKRLQCYRSIIFNIHNIGAKVVKIKKKSYEPHHCIEFMFAMIEKIQPVSSLFFVFVLFLIEEILYSILAVSDQGS